MFKALWAYDNCLSEKQVDYVVKRAQSLPVETGTLRRDNEINTDLRNSSVRWIQRGEDGELMWLFNMIDHSVWTLNRHWHGIDYDYHACGSIQYAEYNEGQFYSNHMDTIFIEGEQVQRKVSCSVLLSSPDEFEGGELYIQNGTLERENLKKGQIVTFPSIIDHEVRPVTKGIRRGLVAWYTGPCWR